MLEMKISILVAVAAAAVPCAVEARTAVLLDFTQVAQSAPIGSASEIEGDPEPGPAVERALGSFMAQTPEQEGIDSQIEPLPTAEIAVPGWMRGRTRRVASIAAAASPFPAIAEGCTWEPYRPNPRLKIDTERRRAEYYGLVAAAACEAGVPTHLLMRSWFRRAATIPQRGARKARSGCPS
ncbi:hypothetical protein NOVOSPHI9U_370037 [Novosphingobium sp. 9U]|nr:hypothetical protein NOVOSPHI9U_370037 [Novosphingobium sp. 9U]